MSPLLLVAIALITYGTRAAALVFMPRPSARIEAMLGRMPAPIFAGLATATLLTGDGSAIGGPILWAALGALLASPARSLLFCLLGAPPAMRWELSCAELPPESRHPWRPDRSPTSRWSRSTILARALS